MMTKGSNIEANSSGVQPLRQDNPPKHVKPAISVVIPTYNRAHMIGRAIRSVLRQTYESFELIVVDDGSNDDTEEVVGGIEDERVRYVYQENSGANVARNRGAREAKGIYLTFLDSDDEAYEPWLERMVEGFTKHGADIVSCGVARYFQGEKEPFEINRPKRYGPMFHYIEGHFNGGSYALKIEYFEQIDGFHEPLRSGQHTELAIRLGELSATNYLKTHIIDDVLIKINVHQGERIRNDYAAKVAGVREFLRLHGGRAKAVSPSTYATYCGVGCVNSLRVRDRKSALNFAVDALRTRPKRVIHWLRFARCILPFWINDLWDSYSRKRHDNTE